MMEKELIKRLLSMVRKNEWQYHHAAENPYCPFCVTDDEWWDDQKEHHPGCEYIALVAEAEEYLAGEE